MSAESGMQGAGGASSVDQHKAEVGAGERFEFGSNWERFLSLLDDERIAASEDAIREKLSMRSLEGMTFLDVGCGSGLSSLAARRLGARVTSFDFDPKSVACCEELRRRVFDDDDENWTVTRGSVLDREFLSSLGTYDIVYSWGVLHHTGAMWTALENVVGLVKPGGALHIAIYNDQGWLSAFWLRIKRLYNRLPRVLGYLLVLVCGAYFLVRNRVGRLLTLRNPFRRNTKIVRGMSVWHDLVDWVGGYPFEVASPERVFEFCRDRGFELKKLTTCGGGLGCNEFVFERKRVSADHES